MLKSIKSRFVFFSSFAILLIFILVSVISSKSIIQIGDAILTKSAMPIVQTAAKIIDGDKFEKLARNLSESDPYYEELRIALFNLKESVGSEFLYTFVHYGSVERNCLEIHC